MNDLETHVKKVIKCLEKRLEEVRVQQEESSDLRDDYYLDGLEVGISWALHILKDIIPCPYEIEQGEDETKP
jgi:hypothetical protein